MTQGTEETGLWDRHGLLHDSQPGQPRVVVLECHQQGSKLTPQRPPTHATVTSELPPIGVIRLGFQQVIFKLPFAQTFIYGFQALIVSY